MQSLETVERIFRVDAPEDFELPDFKGAIGVNDDSVAGCDVVVPVFNFGASYPVPRELFTSAYKLILFGLTARMNDAPFRGLKKGECLFLGATAEERTGQPYVIVNYKFAGSPEKTFTNSEIGDLIGFTKRGWDYLWIRYGSTTDANTLVRQPVAGYVERVYEFGDFSLLGLGV